MQKTPVWFFWCDWVTSSPGWRCNHDSRGKISQPPLAGNAPMTKIQLSSAPNDTTQVYSILQFTIIFTTLKSLKITRLLPFNSMPVNHFTTSWPWDWRLQSRLSFVHLMHLLFLMVLSSTSSRSHCEWSSFRHLLDDEHRIASSKAPSPTPSSTQWTTWTRIEVYKRFKNVEFNPALQNIVIVAARHCQLVAVRRHKSFCMCC